MTGISLRSSTRSEWIKFRSVPSTLYSVIAMFVLTLGLGALINLGISHDYQSHSEKIFDPLATSLFGTFFAQFVVGVIGALIVTNEYTSGSIRNSLAAVPRRVLLIASKLVVLVVVLIAISEIIVFLAFFIGQAILKTGRAPTFTIGSTGVLRGVVLAGVYLVLLGAMGFAFGLLLRKTTAAIVVFVVVQLVVPGLLFLLPTRWGQPILRYMPNELGVGMMTANHAPGTFAPVECTLLLLVYVVALLAIGTALMNSRDA